ncbi:MAG: altronate dehydratase family protein [Steroidobacteraceae bacterium]
MAAQLLRVDTRDNVATALQDLAAGTLAQLTPDGQILLIDAVRRGHKIALADIAAGESVIKYGFTCARASTAITAGQHVHTHNAVTTLTAGAKFHYQPEVDPRAALPDAPHFMGYRRADGRVGTRNEIWIIPTVGCVARTAERIAREAGAKHAGAVDGIHAFAHPLGCSQLGDDLDGTRNLLAALALHPNAGGVLLIGLGCESNQMRQLVERIGSTGKPVHTLIAQQSEDEHAAGLELIDALVAVAGKARREPVPLRDLVVGLKCGGSDGMSGLTANPVVGRISDAVTSAGGSAILTEIPEIFGAEQLLMKRAEDAGVFAEIVSLVQRFRLYYVEHGQPVSENPSPGNIEGGITTLEEKSLGAVQKAGRATVTAVIAYGERIGKHGLTLLESPGNDAISSTALAAAGANVILFTTGRGTPLGFPVPTIKISSNSDLAKRKPGWIDFDAGQVLEQGLESVSDAMLQHVCAVASGAQTAAEKNGEREIAIWKRGVTL